jgi:hypothetical protein
MRTENRNFRKLTTAAVVAWLTMVMPVGVGATTYLPGQSPALSLSPPGTFDLGAHLPSYIGPTNSDGGTPAADGTNLDGKRVYFFDVNDPLGPTSPAATANFNLLVWQFNSTKDSVRLYTHQDHLFEFTGALLAAEELEYSVWGCNGPTGGCKSQSDWTLLSDPISFVFDSDGNPIYSFAGTAATTIYRGGSAEFGLVNANVQDFTFATSYNFFAIRGSTIAMQFNTADPELDAMVAFNRTDFPAPGTIPEPATLVLLVVPLAAIGFAARRRLT